MKLCVNLWRKYHRSHISTIRLMSTWVNTKIELVFLEIRIEGSFHATPFSKSKFKSNSIFLFIFIPHQLFLVSSQHTPLHHSSFPSFIKSGRENVQKNFEKETLNKSTRILGYIDVTKFLMYSVRGFQLLKIDPFRRFSPKFQLEISARNLNFNSLEF